MSVKLLSKGGRFAGDALKSLFKVPGTNQFMKADVSKLRLKLTVIVIAKVSRACPF